MSNNLKKHRFGAITLLALCMVMILCLPVLIPGGSMNTDALPEEEEGGEEWDFDLDGALIGERIPSLLELLLPSACAEETENAEEADPAYDLGFDLYTGGRTPDPEGFVYTEDGDMARYQDDSITVVMETRYEDGVSWRIAYVTVRHPSQLRTAVAGSKVTKKTTAVCSSMVKKYNAIVAMNGDDYQNNPSAKCFEYRMGQKISAKSNSKRDILITDENGDLRIFVKSDAEKLKAFVNEGHKIVNAFMFGPALVIDGEWQAIPKDYKYNPMGNEPRSAIGQTGPLSYVLVVADGRNESSSRGVTMEELADFMFYKLDCVQAYNIDGGNSAEMLTWGGRMYMDKKHTERDMNDIIYFASASEAGE